MMFRIITSRKLNQLEEEIQKLMAVSTAFQAQLDRLTTYVNGLTGAVAAKDAEDTQALSNALDSVSAPPVPTPPAPPAA
jgi:hypothetical protein